MAAEDWRPVASPEVLQARAKLLQELRAFFATAGVLEVETPILSRYSITDPQIWPLRAEYLSGGPSASEKYYLHTSPEFAMKRLLAAGIGPIFQICKVFRNAEQGLRHNPEFSMLEWYRPGFDEQQLMDELMALVQILLPGMNWRRLSYQQIFQEYLQIDPFNMEVDALAALARQKIETSFMAAKVSKDTWLDLLFSHLIEPQLQDPVFIHDYPPSQAALAELACNAEGLEVARRFELIIGGMEIANGYRELLNPQEQRLRFEQELKIETPVARREDEYLLSALEHGLPQCAGVAVGLDRILMLQCGLDSIDEALSFPFSRA